MEGYIGVWRYAILELTAINDDESNDRVGSPGVAEMLRWEGFVEKVGFEHGVKESRSDG